LLEHYQWGDKPVGGEAAVAEELADVFIYAMQIAQRNNIDLAAEVEKKLEKAAKKYPAKDFKGKTVEDRSQAWMQRKLAHKKEGL
jgi:NTP pyrophosphatase (non-canonical NTP hydrolase)